MALQYYFFVARKLYTTMVSFAATQINYRGQLYGTWILVSLLVLLCFYTAGLEIDRTITVTALAGSAALALWCMPALASARDHRVTQHMVG